MCEATQHRRLSPVRACVLLIVVYLGVCAVLFGDETRPKLSGLSDSLSPVHDAREREQRTQRSNDDRVQDFYQSLRTQQVQQQRADAQGASDAQRYARRSRPAHYAHRPRK